MESAGYLFLLAFVLLRFTRGQAGVSVVCDYILEHWSVFVHDFDAFCLGLVRHCEAVCKEKGRSYLAHREGLHTQYSGLHFIRTLRRVRIRRRLVAFTEKWAHLVSGGGISSADIMAMGESIPDHVAVAVQNNKVKMAGKYNAMNCMMCFMHMVVYCMGGTPTEYTEELHQWFLKRQCRKGYAKAELAYFGVVSCDTMTTAVGRMSKALQTTSKVSVATMYVLFCETRQAINRYSLRGVWYLIDAYDKRKSVRENVSRVRPGLVSTRCHTIQLLEAIRSSVCVSLAVLRTLGRGVSDGGPWEVAYQLGRRRLCPKVESDGIPELRVLASCLTVLTQKVQTYARQPSQQYRGLVKAAKGLGIKYGKSHTVKKLARLVKRGMLQPSGTGACKRTYQELVSAAHARGASEYQRIKVQGRWTTRRVSKATLEALVAEP